MSYVKGVTKSALQKNFLALQASVRSKNEGGGGGAFPGTSTAGKLQH